MSHDLTPNVYSSGPVRSGDAQAVIDTATAAAAPTVLDAGLAHGIVVPAGADHITLDLERFLKHPRRPAGDVTVQTVDDLIRYVTRHDDPAATTIWVAQDTAVIVAVLNDHETEGDVEGLAGWGDHRAVLQLKPTPEWLHWTGKDRQLLGQAEFSEHIEDGLDDIVEPTGAAMLEIAQSLRETTNSQFKSGTRLTDGQRVFSHVEEKTASAGEKGELAIPEAFKLGLAPFIGEELFSVKARLRYRAGGGDLKLGYKLDRPHLVVQACIDEIADRLSKQFADRVFIGKPAAHESRTTGKR